MNIEISKEGVWRAHGPDRCIFYVLGVPRKNFRDHSHLGIGIRFLNFDCRCKTNDTSAENMDRRSHEIMENRLTRD